MILRFCLRAKAPKELEGSGFSPVRDARAKAFRLLYGGISSLWSALADSNNTIGNPPAS